MSGWRRWRRDPRVWLAAAAVVLVAVAVVVAPGGPIGDGPEADFAGVRAAPVPYDGRSPRVPAGDEQRVLVSLARPSLGEKAAQRARSGLTPLTPRSQRRYVASLRREGEALRSALGARGVRLRDVAAFERTINGFAATIRTRDLTAVTSLGARARPVRRFFPAGSEPVAVGGGAPATADARAIGPVALLDTGVDLAHPALRGRVEAGADTVAGDSDPSPGRDPRARGRVETHGTALAGVLAAAGVRVRAYRVAGLQTVESGGAQTFATTDQLLAGLERVVDPDGDGDTEDSPALALVGVSAPYAGFAGAPEARAAEGAAALGTLVIAPAGQEGAATGPNGTIGSPGAARSVLTVGAAVRATSGVARVELSIGDVVRVNDAAVLAGPAPRLRGGAVRTSTPLVDTDPRVLLRQVGRRLPGQVAIVRAGAAQSAAAQAAAAGAAGAAAVVLCDGRDDATLPALPAGRVPVPVLGVTGAAARAVLAAAPGQPVTTGDARAPGDGGGPLALAPASSRGPALDGTPKPDVAADAAARAALPGGGSGLVAGSSVAAARAAIGAARLLDAEPDLPPAQIVARMRGAADPAPALPAAGAGAGLLGAGAPQLVVSDARTWSALGDRPRGRFATIANAGTRPLNVRVTAEPDPGSRTKAAVVPPAFRLAPGAEQIVTLTLQSGATGLGFAQGKAIARAQGAAAVAIPWLAPIGMPPPPRIGRPALIRRGERVGGVRFALGEFRRGDPARAAATSFQPVERLELSLIGARKGDVVRRLTPSGGALELLPAEYEYTLAAKDLKALGQGSYAFRIRAWAPRQAQPAEARSEAFSVR